MKKTRYTKLTEGLDKSQAILSLIDKKNPDFQKIIQLGAVIIPLLLQDILCGKDPHWRFATICKIAEKEKLDQVVIPIESF